MSKETSNDMSSSGFSVQHQVMKDVYHPSSMLMVPMVPIMDGRVRTGFPRNGSHMSLPHFPNQDIDKGANVLQSRGVVCEACRAAKVKCDRKTPCSRCVRLMLTCTPTPPSKRGRKRRAAFPGCEDAVLNAIVKKNKASGSKKQKKSREKGKNDGAAASTNVRLGVLFLCRTWLSFAFRRRDISMFGKIAKLATSTGTSMDDIFVDTDVESDSVAYVKDLFFAKSIPKVKELFGPRLKLEDFPRDLVDKLSPYTGPVDGTVVSEPCYMFGRVVDKGVVRYYFSPESQKVFVGDDEECDLCKRVPCWNPIFKTPIAHDVVMKTVGKMYSAIEKVNVTGKLSQVTVYVNTRKGESLLMDVSIGVKVLSSTKGALLFACRKAEPLEVRPMGNSTSSKHSTTRKVSEETPPDVDSGLPFTETLFHSPSKESGAFDHPELFFPS